MAYWLDYSAAKIPGGVIKNAGYLGVIRYIDAPTLLRTKHTNLEEYRSHVAAGLSVLLVMQTTTTASDGGYATGQDHGRRALAGASHLGYSGPIFFTNDRTNLPDPAAWRAYLDGAASILGIGRVGAYGFRNAMDAAAGHATYFWQAGRRSDVAAHTHVWQDNNTQVTVGGITCDRNLILKTITASTGGFLMSLSDKEQRDLYDRIFGMLRQRYYLPGDDDPDTVREVSADSPGAVPATVLDSLDGNYLVRRLAALEEAAPAAAPVELTDEQLDDLADRVAARLGSLKFVANTEES